MDGIIVEPISCTAPLLMHDLVFGMMEPVAFDWDAWIADRPLAQDGRPAPAFAAQAAMAGLAYIALGRLARSNAMADEVKHLAQRVLDDQGIANARLAEIARRHGFALPAMAEAERAAEADRIARLPGGAFDYAYVQAVIRHHESDVALYRAEADAEPEAAAGAAARLHAFARRTLPILQQHLDLAREIAGGAGG